MIEVDETCRRIKSEIYAKVAACYSYGLGPDKVEECVKTGLDVVDATNDWVLRGVIASKQMWKRCISDCETQIFEGIKELQLAEGKQLVDGKPILDHETEMRLRGELSACSGECADHFSREFTQG